MHPEHERILACVESFLDGYEILNTTQKAQLGEQARQLIERVQADFRDDCSERTMAVVGTAVNLVEMLAGFGRNDPAVNWLVATKALVQKLRALLTSSSQQP